MITANELREFLDYDPDTGIFTWKKRAALRTKIGAMAGSINQKGRRMIWLHNKQYVAARLAWLHVHGRWPLGQIDHIDTDRLNDRIANLREATNSENMRNQTRRSDNTSGHRGVNWNIGVGQWIARIIIDGRRKHLGCFDNIQDAIDAYRAAALKHYGPFARFDD